MNETTTGPDIPPGRPQDPAAGPTPPGSPPPYQDLDLLRRSRSDRYLAGVAGGLGRHFGVDPTIIRVLLAVLAFFGGAGVLVYAVCWLLVPEEGKDRAAIRTSGETLKLVLLAAAGVAVVLAVGDASSDFNAGWWIASLAVITAVVLIVRDRRENRGALPTPPYAGYPGQYGEQPRESSGEQCREQYREQSQAYARDYAEQWSRYATETAEAAVQQAMASVPPTPPVPPTWQPPAFPPHAKRTGVLWFWPTLALIAIALGVLGVIDAGGTEVAPGVYPATALAVTGVMLLIGSFVGRPGGLVLIGLVSAGALAVSTVVGGFNFSGQDLRLDPRSAAEVESSYEIHNGRLELDLTQVVDPAALAGRSIELTLKAGEIHVIVPRSLNLRIDAEFDFAGGIRIPGYDGGGIQDSVERTVVGTGSSTTPPLDLELDATVGQITVEQR